MTIEYLNGVKKHNPIVDYEDYQFTILILHESLEFSNPNDRKIILQYLLYFKDIIQNLEGISILFTLSLISLIF